MDPNMLVTMALAYEIENAVSALPPKTLLTEEHLPCRLRFAEAAIFLDNMVRYGQLSMDAKGQYWTPSAVRPVEP